MISDIHFGVRSNSLEWLQIQKDYFNNFFIPLLKSKFQRDDMLWILGDVFDQRQSINSLIQNTALKIFSDLSKILPVHILVGNHDIYYKSTNDVNSLLPLSFLPNITIYEEPVKLDLYNDRTLFVMPWRKDLNAEKETLDNETADILFCHTGYAGAFQNKFAEIHESLCSLDNFLRYKRVYSGHIHYRQELNNVKLIGCPYQLTRSDVDNQKGVYLLDLEKETEEFFENDYSPKYLKISLENILKFKESEFISYVDNNFVDVLIPSKISDGFPVDKLINLTDRYRQLNFRVISDDKDYLELDDLDSDFDISDFNIIKIIKDYVSDLNEKSSTKKIIIDKISDYYTQATEK